MLDQFVLWSYGSVWRSSSMAVRGLSGNRDQRRDAGLAATDAEQDAYGMVISKARFGFAPAVWAKADRIGHA